MPRPSDQWKCEVFGGTQDGHKFWLEDILETFSDEVAEVETEYGIFTIDVEEKEVLYMPMDWIMRHTEGKFTLPLEETN